MADDFLGKKMDDYRRGITGGKYRPKSKPSISARSGILAVPFPETKIFVANAPSSSVLTEIVRLAAKNGAKVAFNGEGGRELAYATGSRWHETDDPCRAATEVEKVWRGLDIAIGNEVLPEINARKIIVTDRADYQVMGSETAIIYIPGVTPADEAAWLALFLCSPAGSGITGQAIRLRPE